MIGCSDISIVCQGAVSAGLTAECLRSCRAALPGAEIVLSTWEGTDVFGLDFDAVVFSPDPGFCMADETVGLPNNVNRQLVSTKRGLAAASRPYIMKTRTDIRLENRDFLSFFGRYDGSASPFFRNRLLTCSYYTRNPRVFRTCFHPSDWFMFGRAEDMHRYYDDIPLMSGEEGVWLKQRDKAPTFFTNYICRYTPEQQIFIGFLRQHEKVDCDCYYERTPALVEQTERAFAECFVVLDYGKQLGIRFMKYAPNRYLEKYTLVSHWQWRAMYERYCENRTGSFWLAYHLRCSSLCLTARLRTGCVRLLARIGLKERVKTLLAKRRNG